MDLEWQDKAACLGMYPLVDFITAGKGQAHLIDKNIEKFCHHCPVVRECADHALSNTATLTGIWGGVYVGMQKGKGGRQRGIKRLRDVYATLSQR